MQVWEAFMNYVTLVINDESSLLHMTLSKLFWTHRFDSSTASIPILITFHISQKHENVWWAEKLAVM
ncbi:CLUMA_CG018512, isoform A [Clunio marinus]|uniref:CLUMA_CG018512, isoform A n=1 Tax=Clunio marinus TaxID=568069 RepID=A0A1J1IXK1_9DIPT|nr:CLUMA_CG018512, isoform A [Clunio marinus]